MARILITDGDTRSALAATRALGQSGHEVYVTAPSGRALAAVSRWCTAYAPAPHPLSDPDGAMAAVVGAVRRWHPHVVIPATDVSALMLLSRHGNQVEGAILAAPAPEAFNLMSDKAGLIARGKDAGFQLPETIIVETPERLPEAAKVLGFPCVIRPHRSVVIEGNRAHSLGVRRVLSPRDLDPALPAAAFPVVAQRFVPGTGEGVFLLMDGSRVIASFAHRRIREKPPEGGTSVCCESIALEPGLLAASTRLLTGAGWRGIAMVELRRSVTGQAYLMEVNGRLWGSLQLAVDAGVNFPALMVSLFMGEAVPPQIPFRVGVRSRWFWGELDHLLARVKRLYRRQPVPATLPSFPAFLADFAFGVLRPRERFDILVGGDVRPFVRETLDRWGL